MRALEASTADGASLYLRPDRGNTAELKLVGAALERLLDLSEPGMLMVCDSALSQPKTLCQIDRASLRFIVPLRADTGFKERYLAEPRARRLRPLGYVAEPRAPPAAGAAHPVSRRALGLGAERSRNLQAAPLPRRLHPLLRGGARGRLSPRARARQGRGAARPR